MKFRTALLAGASLFVLAQSTHLAAQPMGGFAAVLDKNSGFTDTPRSVVFYDIDDMSAPLFGVYVGNEAGGNEDPNSITVDPSTGDVYAISYDSDGSSLDPYEPEIEDDGDPDGQGDFDLVRIDFATAYDHWATNFQASGTFVTYGDGGFFSINPDQHPNPQAAPIITTKIGEIGRSQGDGSFFDTRLEFLNSETLLYVDSQTADTGGTTDVQIRAINRVSTSSGAAMQAGVPLGREGGFNNNTTESWESTVIGHVELDGAATSEVIGIKAVERDGITGLWISEDDGDGDDVAFFEITSLSGTAGNSYRTIDFDAVSDTRFSMDNNPSVDPNEDFGNGASLLVDPTTGDVVFVESGFFDGHQPTVYKLGIDSYDNAGAIDAGAFSANVVLDTTGIYDDGVGDPVPLIDGRNAIFDWVNNDVYFFDEDNSGDTGMGGAAFTHDWYKLDLDTGVTTAVGPDADTSNGLFDSSGRAGDQVLFFHLDSNPTVACDLDGDGFCTETDLRQLYDDIDAGTLGGASDLDGSGTVDNNDIDDWLVEAGTFNGKEYKVGDTNFDGDVGGPDFTLLAASFGDEGLPGAYWDQGNFNGADPDDVFRVGGADFTGLAVNFGHTSVSAVPEPSAWGMLFVSLIGLLGVRRRS